MPTDHLKVLNVSSFTDLGLQKHLPWMRAVRAKGG